MPGCVHLLDICFPIQNVSSDNVEAGKLNINDILNLDFLFFNKVRIKFSQLWNYAGHWKKNVPKKNLSEGYERKHFMRMAYSRVNKIVCGAFNS